MIRLLDTNVCIQLWQRKNKQVRARFEMFSPAEVSICSVVKAELLYGALRSQRSEQNTQLLIEIFEPLHSYEFNDACAEHYAEIRANLAETGTLIGANDLMIAAIALANKTILVTNNTAEFKRVPKLVLEDWQT